MRCPSDLPFAALCDRVGINNISSDDVEFFKSRIVTEEIEEEQDNENFKTGLVSIIVTTNEDREAINLSKLRALLPAAEEYVCLSNDRVTNRKTHTPVPEAFSYTSVHGMMRNLILDKNCNNS